MDTCDRYVGLACVNGYCPAVTTEKYANIGVDIGLPSNFSCSECGWNKGCEDCMFYDTEDCKSQKTSNERGEKDMTLFKIIWIVCGGVWGIVIFGFVGFAIFNRIRNRRKK